MDSFMKMIAERAAKQVGAKKKNRDKLRYRVQKESAKYVKTGCGHGRAKIGSELDYYHKHPTEVPEHFLVPSDGKKAITIATLALPLRYEKALDSPIGDLIQNITTDLEGKESGVSGQLGKAEAKGLRGLWAIYDAKVGLKVYADHASKLDIPMQACEDGFGPIAVAVRTKTLRAGGSSFPLTGIGCWIWARHGEVQLAIVCGDKLINTGDMATYDAKELDKALESKAMTTYKPEMAIIPHHGVAWVPYGMIALVTGQDNVNEFTVLPHLNDDLAAECDKDTLECLLRGTVKIAKQNN
jgi:hypothetical protein